jgi:hypothetical protein
LYRETSSIVIPTEVGCHLAARPKTGCVEDTICRIAGKRKIVTCSGHRGAASGDQFPIGLND